MKLISVVMPIFLFVSYNLSPQIEPKAVSIEGSDKFVLKGKYYSSGKPGPGVLLLHQCDRKGPLTGYENLALMLAQAGFNVLIPDGRGFGESRNDEFRDFGSQMDVIEPKASQDTEAFYNFLRSQRDVEKESIGIAGASCGVRQAIRLAANHSEIKTLVFISGAYSPTGEIAQNYERILQLPVLCIYSEEDRYGTPRAMRASFEKSQNANSKLITYKGNLHGTPLLAQDAILEKGIAGWFIAHLKKR